MLKAIGSRLVGAAAKAGVAALQGALGAPGLVAGTNLVTGNDVVGNDVMLSLLGYLIIGLAGGLANWAGVYFKRNPGYK